LCFIGHSHQPGHWSVGSWGPERRAGTEAITLEAGRRYLVNVGSVGQPRDGDPRACYAVWDLPARTIGFRRVAYDVAGAQRKILAAGLPRFLADRLPRGL
jgi:diadenosine tetraphosphatase ApaH/serine/threonine PP2A family protein phosphatase